MRVEGREEKTIGLRDERGQETVCGNEIIGLFVVRKIVLHVLFLSRPLRLAGPRVILKAVRPFA